MKWVYSFINSANFEARNQKTFITIIQFSGVAQGWVYLVRILFYWLKVFHKVRPNQAVSSYSPGGMGVAVAGAEGTENLYHWKQIDSFKRPTKNG